MRSGEKIKTLMVLNDLLIEVRRMKRSLVGAVFVHEHKVGDYQVGDGGPGSGNHGHAGRPGEVGGSAPEKGSGGGNKEEKKERKAESPKGGGAKKTKHDPSKAKGKGASMQKKYGGTANHHGVGNGSKGHKPEYKNGTGKTKINPVDIAEGDHSLKDHLDQEGKLLPERESLHNEIVNKHFEAVEKPDGQPTFYMMGGGPASGKSGVLNSGQVEVPDKFDGVHVNSDDIKREIPEYQKGVEAGNLDAANYAHEESSALAKRVMSTGMENGYNVVLDGTGDGSVRSVMSKIEEARAKGMKVEGYYVTCPTQIAVDRNQARANDPKEKGRLVREEIVRATHKKVSQILPQVAKHFDRVQLYDSGDGFPPKLIAEGGGGKDLTILDAKRYDAFLRKADE